MTLHHELIGLDIEFLVQSIDGSRVWYAGEIAEAIEDDSHYDVPGRVADAYVYVLRLGALPAPVEIKYADPAPEDAAQTKTPYRLMQVYRGIDLIAQVPVSINSK